MVRVYVAELTGWRKQGLPAEAAAALSAERRDRWERQKGHSGALQSAAAELLLRRALREQEIPLPVPWLWERTEGGKPFVQGLTGITFNLSHSGRYVVCALAREPVGVDVQMIPDRERCATVRRFCREEMQEVEEAENPAEAFCRIWTAKEAYLKMRGTGLRRPLDSFRINPDGCVEDPPGTQTDCRVTWLPVWPGRRDAALAVCARERCRDTAVFWKEEELLPHNSHML
ncbi:MAG: 4'-phosphopantetheinyl transferase superfamily protein [Lachnospiraceae bacterium]|nr:4'-phosphopantetheinyl transferase superfamily protein [Lachnospiraceae bacterium]